MKAKDAREIMAISKRHKEDILESIYKQVRTQAEEGLNWAHVTLPPYSTTTLESWTKDTLRIAGFRVPNEIGITFKIEW